MTSTIFPRTLRGVAKALRTGLFFVLLTATGFVATPGARGADTLPRARIRFDAHWRFQVAPAVKSTGGGITGWQWHPASDAADAASRAAGAGSVPDIWNPAAIGDDVFANRPGFAVFRVILPADKGRVPDAIHFDAVDDNAVVYVNGTRLAAHEGWDEPFTVPLTASVWRADAPNVITVVVENKAGAGGITGDVVLIRPGAAVASSPQIADPAFDDRAWRTVHLPHDYVIEQPFTKGANVAHGSLPTPPAWYRKTFTLPASYKGKSLWLEFDGVYRDSRVYLNGHLLGRHQGGYTPFRYDLAPFARIGGPNTLAVAVDPGKYEGWFYEGGGIYRHVWLNVADPLHIAPDGVFVSSKVNGDESRPASATVALKATLNNSTGAGASVSVAWEIHNRGGQTVARVSKSVALGAGASQAAEQTLTLPTPALWSVETPNLYTLVTTVTQGGKIIDRQTTPFGVRTFRWDANKGLFLNGKPLKIKGTCNHQDFAGVGAGVPDGVQEWRIRKLQSMGSNAYRASHNPPTTELLDACDRLGMIVLDENRHLGDTFAAKTPRGTRSDDNSELISLIIRDRNHPSVFMWSLCNEEPLQGGAEGGRIFADMKKAAQQYDDTRPFSSAMNGGWGGGITLVQDVQGCNYRIGDYDSFHARFPQMPVYGSETASTVSTRGIYENDKVRGYVSAYDLNAPSWATTAEKAWTALANRDFMAGGFVWTGFDYRGEPTPYGWPCINSHFGIMDMCGFPKDNYYYYKAWWGDKPVVHLLPHWNWPGKEGQPINVWCQGNAQTVELFLNGVSLGAPKLMPRLGHGEWSVNYAPGRLEARGYDSAGKVVATDRVETTGAPAALVVTTDRRTVLADGEDVTMVEVAVVDAQGRVVPEASNDIAFATRGGGTIAGVGNGDPSSHESDAASRRHAFNGRCMVLVRGGNRAGKVTLEATSPGLRGATLPLTVIATGEPDR